jgi:hypothetical protein
VKLIALMSEAQILAAVDKEIKRGAARSAVYRQAMIDVLRYRFWGVAIPHRYTPGTVEADAYFAGNERGHLLWRELHGSECAV